MHSSCVICRAPAAPLRRVRSLRPFKHVCMDGRETRSLDLGVICSSSVPGKCVQEPTMILVGGAARSTLLKGILTLHSGHTQGGLPC